MSLLCGRNRQVLWVIYLSRLIEFDCGRLWTARTKPVRFGELQFVTYKSTYTSVPKSVYARFLLACVVFIVSS